MHDMHINVKCKHCGASTPFAESEDGYVGSFCAAGDVITAFVSHHWNCYLLDPPFTPTMTPFHFETTAGKEGVIEHKPLPLTDEQKAWLKRVQEAQSGATT